MADSCRNDVCSLLNYNNTASVIVTYNPDNTFEINLKRISELFSHVVVVDNNSITSVLSYLENVCGVYDNVSLICLSDNLGIAKGLNIGLKKALEFSPLWIITFDQDSFPCDSFLYYYNEVLSHIDLCSLGLLSSYWLHG